MDAGGRATPGAVAEARGAEPGCSGGDFAVGRPHGRYLPRRRFRHFRLSRGRHQCRRRAAGPSSNPFTRAGKTRRRDQPGPGAVVAGPDPCPERCAGNRQSRKGAGAGGGWHFRHLITVRRAGPAADTGTALQRPACNDASHADRGAGPATSRGPRPDQQPRQAAVVPGQRTCQAGGPRAAPGRLDCRPADRRLRPQRLPQLSQARLRRRTARVAGMVCRSRRQYRAAAAGACAG